MTYIQESIIRQTVQNAGKKFFTVHYIKDNGELRVLNGQLVKSAPTHKNHRELFCILLNNGQVRTARYNKIVSIRSQGLVISTKEAV
mgnify:FL=1